MHKVVSSTKFIITEKTTKQDPQLIITPKNGSDEVDAYISEIKSGGLN